MLMLWIAMDWLRLSPDIRLLILRVWPPRMREGEWPYFRKASDGPNSLFADAVNPLQTALRARKTLLPAHFSSRCLLDPRTIDARRKFYFVKEMLPRYSDF